MPHPLCQALRETFIQLNDGFLAGATADDSGCTTLAAVCLPAQASAPGHVLVANAGDCVCVLWRGDEVTTTQRLSNP